jgi:hypothetical protein
MDILNKIERENHSDIVKARLLYGCLTSTITLPLTLQSTAMKPQYNKFNFDFAKNFRANGVKTLP